MHAGGFVNIRETLVASACRYGALGVKGPRNENELAHVEAAWQ